MMSTSLPYHIVEMEKRMMITAGGMIGIVF